MRDSNIIQQVIPKSFTKTLLKKSIEMKTMHVVYMYGKPASLNVPTHLHFWRSPPCLRNHAQAQLAAKSRLTGNGMCGAILGPSYTKPSLNLSAYPCQGSSHYFAFAPFSFRRLSRCLSTTAGEAACPAWKQAALWKSACLTPKNTKSMSSWDNHQLWYQWIPLCLMSLVSPPLYLILHSLPNFLYASHHC